MLQSPCFKCLEDGDLKEELVAPDQPHLYPHFVQSHGSCQFQLCSGRKDIHCLDIQSMYVIGVLGKSFRNWSGTKRERGHGQLQI